MHRDELAPQLLAPRRPLACWLLLILPLACARPPSAPPPPVVDAKPAGTVERVEGQVTAQRAGMPPPPRPLVARAPVWADDTVTTAADAAVAIRLLHNGALWELQGAQTRRVDAGLAWRAPHAVAAVALADAPEKPATAAAARHSEQEAAQTAESAPRPEPPPAPKPQPPVKVKRAVPHAGGSPASQARVDAHQADALAAKLEALAQAPAEPTHAGNAVADDHLDRVREPAGAVSASSSDVRGSLSPEVVQQFLAPLKGRIRQCYAGYLARHPDAAGRVVLHVAFDAQGRVSAAVAVSPTLAAEVLRCIEGVVKHAPRATMKSVSFQLPFVFKPAE